MPLDLLYDLRCELARAAARRQLAFDTAEHDPNNGQFTGHGGGGAHEKASAKHSEMKEHHFGEMQKHHAAGNLGKAAEHRTTANKHGHAAGQHYEAHQAKLNNHPQYPKMAARANKSSFEANRATEKVHGKPPGTAFIAP